MSICRRLLPLVLLVAATPLASAADDASPSQSVPKTSVAGHFAGLIDIGGGRKLYLSCRGKGSPPVILLGGLRASADDWMTTLPGKPNVFSAVAAFTRVCAYDRPGTPVGDQPSRSDPVAQPTTAADAVADLHALIAAAGIETPAVLVGHSYGGLITRLFAGTYPDEVSGMVLVDALTEGLRQAETQQEWAIQRELINGDTKNSVRLYPALERLDVDRSFDQLVAAAPIKPMPLVVLSADRPWGPRVPALIAKGELPTDVPKDFGYVTDRAQKEAQAKLAALVPGAKHVTETHSGHEIHKDQPQLVTDSIREVVEAVRSKRSQLVP
jgi:pimeloyl-ACP methyl ester carboxylesterase